MAKTAALHLEGVVDHVLYCNAENGYTVLELDAGSALVTVVGEIGEVEEGESLTAETLNKLYYDLNCKYFGPDMVSDSEIAYEWARIPHFYYNFYVYQYATGFSAAIAISSKILAKEEGIVEKYKAFLSGGCSMDPIDLLKLCGVDMEKKEPVEEALKVFEQYLTELEKLV